MKAWHGKVGRVQLVAVWWAHSALENERMREGHVGWNAVWVITGNTSGDGRHEYEVEQHEICPRTEIRHLHTIASGSLCQLHVFPDVALRVGVTHLWRRHTRTRVPQIPDRLYQNPSVVDGTYPRRCVQSRVRNVLSESESAVMGHVGGPRSVHTDRP